MKRFFPIIFLWLVVLFSLSCSVISGSPAPLPTLSKPTPLSPGSQPYDEAVAARDDISIVRFIANELRRAELDTPYSPFEMCYEEETLTVKTGANGKFAAELVKDCGSSQDGDFSMSSTVILNSSAKTATCGYVLRSDGKGFEYALRLEQSEGSSRWSLVRLADGVVAGVLSEPAADDDLDLSDGKQTRVLLYVRGEIMKGFFNNSFAGMVMDSDLSAGTLSLFAESESHTATCRYDAFWVNIYH